MEGRIIRTCRLLIASAAVAAALAPGSASANRPTDIDAARTYVAARAAALSGNHGQSAQLFATLADAQTQGSAIARQAVSEAISAGDIKLALRLARGIPMEMLPLEARLLLVAEELKGKNTARAIELLGAKSDAGELAFLQPFVAAWAAAERGDDSAALGAIGSVPANSVLGSHTAEHRALLFLKLKRPAAAEPFARRAVSTAGGREQRLRLAFADGFVAAGDRVRALSMLEGMGADAAPVRQKIAAGRSAGSAIDSTSKAFSELLLALAIDLNRLNNRALPVALSQVARHSAPDNAAAAILLGVFLQSRDRVDEALAAFRSVPAEHVLAGQARDSEVRALIRAERLDEALAVAWAAASAPRAGVGDLARLGDAFSAVDRHSEAAATYDKAAVLAADQQPEERWPLLLLKASALESANRWPEARSALGAALALAPDQPLILNFLGYSKLERGEDLDSAEAMIRRASELAPDDASITDSLGWAQYKRGRLEEAIETLERAARSDPLQAEIHEHLGDALYSAGRKFEARFAWRAALATAEDEIATRVERKIESGLTPATAAP